MGSPPTRPLTTPPGSMLSLAGIDLKGLGFRVSGFIGFKRLGFRVFLLGFKGLGFRRVKSVSPQQ